MKRLLLLADDSPTIQRLVTQMFVGGEFEVVSVSNGDAAVRKFEEVRPDLVLADIYMPGKNGYEVCAVVKKHAELGDTPVILLAGAFDAFDQQMADQVGAAAHITKPFEPQALISLVSSLAPKATGRARPPVTAAVRGETVTPAAAAEEPVSPVEPTQEPVASAVPERPQATERLSLVSEAADPPVPPASPEPPAVAPAAVAALLADTPSIVTAAEKPSQKPPQKAEPEKSAAADAGDLLGLEDLFKPALTSAVVSDAEIDRIADRVIQKLSTQVIENVAWDVVPDITTKVLKEELKRQS